MDFFSVLALLGGLAIFLYGMNLMGDGLAKVAGGKLERILETLTSSPIRAVLLGMGVTAVIQSSSATTVMVVGFVNSGLMKLSQVVGIIMGANIGTTVTSWILSLTGIQSDNFIIRLFKPTSFSPVLALIGVVLIMFTKSQKKKDVGNFPTRCLVLLPVQCLQRSFSHHPHPSVSCRHFVLQEWYRSVQHSLLLWDRISVPVSRRFFQPSELTQMRSVRQ